MLSVRQADVSDISAAANAVNAVVKKWGRLDILVQAAGVTGKTNVMTENVEPENFDFVLRINLRGIFAFCKAVRPMLGHEPRRGVCHADLRSFALHLPGALRDEASEVRPHRQHRFDRRQGGECRYARLLVLEGSGDWAHKGDWQGVRRGGRHHVQCHCAGCRAHRHGRCDASGAG